MMCAGAEMPLTALITGGSGYLGQFLVEEFAKTDRVRLCCQANVLRCRRLRAATSSRSRAVAILLMRSISDLRIYKIKRGAYRQLHWSSRLQ